MLEFAIGSAPRSSAVVATLDNAVVRQGDFVFGPVLLQVDAGERIGITGPNGAGKSTLLRLLLGRLQPDEGRANLGANVAIREIDQACADFAGEGRLVDRFEQRRQPGLPPTCEPCSRSSGSVPIMWNARSTSLPGERTRAGLALQQACGTNVLVRDDPTNHLEQARETYDGAKFLVTHDRRMLQNTRLDHSWMVDMPARRSFSATRPGATRCCAARWPAHSSSAGCHAVRVRPRRRSGTGAAAQPVGG